MASLRSASASHALETEHESVTVSLAGRPRSDRSCVSPAATFVISVVALILAIIGLALGIAFLNPRSDIVITRSPVPPAGYKKLGATQLALHVAASSARGGLSGIVFAAASAHWPHAVGLTGMGW